MTTARLEDLLQFRAILVAGKGGVGRTTMTAALAVAAAKAGKRVLVAEFEEPTRQDWSPLAAMFGLPVFPTEPALLRPGIHGVMVDAIVGTERFLTSVIRVETLARIAMRNPALVKLFHAAPSLHELGLFYHLLTLIQARERNGKQRFDLVVIDMPATGHALALTGLPSVLLRLVPSGPIANALREGQAVFNNPELTAAFVVTLPEPLPVSESLELVAGLDETGVRVGAIIANRIPVDPFTPSERLALADLLSGPPVFGEAEVERIERSAVSLERLRASIRVPLLPVSEQPYPPRDRLDDMADDLLAGPERGDP